jgi:hypothetical protein
METDRGRLPTRPLSIAARTRAVAFSSRSSVVSSSGPSTSTKRLSSVPPAISRTSRLSSTSAGAAACKPRTSSSKRSRKHAPSAARHATTSAGRA